MKTLRAHERGLHQTLSFHISLCLATPPVILPVPLHLWRNLVLATWTPNASLISYRELSRQVSSSSREPTTTSRKELSPAAKKMPFSLNHFLLIYSLPFLPPSREDLKITTKHRYAMNQCWGKEEASILTSRWLIQLWRFHVNTSQELPGSHNQRESTIKD